MAGGAIRSVPVEANDAFFGALERAVKHTIPKPIAIVTCYPSNPTACVADLDFYAELVAFAKKHGVFLLSDLAYAEVYFDDNPPPSVLQVPGAIDVAVEFTSMSKTYSMPGWRIGFAVGNERIIAALARVKSYLDYGAFTPIQVAATAALNGPDDCIHEMRDDLSSAAATRWSKASAVPAGRCRRRAPRCSPGRRCRSRSDARQRRVRDPAGREGEVAVSPGIGFGEHGEGHVRIALVENEQRIRQAARNVRRFLETGAGKVAQRRPAGEATLIRRAFAHPALATFDGRAAQSRSCRSRHGRLGRRPAACASARQAIARCGRAIEVVAVSPRSRSKKRAIDLRKLALGRRSGGARGRSRHRRLRRSDGRRRRPAKSAVETALAAGKSVVTANKALLAAHGSSLATLAEQHGVALNFEAAVAGGIPIVKTLREGLDGNRSRASTASSTAPAITSSPAWSRSGSPSPNA